MHMIFLLILFILFTPLLPTRVGFTLILSAHAQTVSDAILSDVTFEATVPTSQSVAGVQWYLDTSPYGSEDTTSPYTTTVSLTSLLASSHTMTAIFRSPGGAMASTRVFTFTTTAVSSPSPTPSPSSTSGGGSGGGSGGSSGSTGGGGTGGGGGGGGSAPSSSPSPAASPSPASSPAPSPSSSVSRPCHLYTSSTQIPLGFGAPYDVFASSRPLLMTVVCTEQGNATVEMNATPNSQYPTRYVYANGYYAKQGDSIWTPIVLADTRKIADSWYSGKATATLSNLLPNTSYYVLGYMCTWNGTTWKCGCRDSACIQPYWQLQSFRR